MLFAGQTGGSYDLISMTKVSTNDNPTPKIDAKRIIIPNVVPSPAG